MYMTVYTQNSKWSSSTATTTNFEERSPTVYVTPESSFLEQPSVATQTTAETVKGSRNVLLEEVAWIIYNHSKFLNSILFLNLVLRTKSYNALYNPFKWEDYIFLTIKN